MKQLPDGLLPLAGYRQWLVYKLVPRANGKTDKIPLNPATGDAVNPHDPLAWVDADTAMSIADLWGDGYGVSFSLTANDPFFFLDIDGAYQDGHWSPLATSLCEQFSGAAVEVSTSQTGLHIIGMSEPFEHGCKNLELGIELYTRDRFIALTGTSLIGNAGTDHTAAIHQVARQLFPVTATGVTSDTWTTEPAPEWNGYDDDDALINAMLNARSAHSSIRGNATVQELWRGDVEALSRAYPDPTDAGRPYDASSADAALAAHLAFWTGGNMERMARLMRRSALVRDKWDTHRSYLERTVRGAANRCQKYHSVGNSPKTPVEPPAPTDTATPIDEPMILNGFPVMSIDQQLEFFKGCVYVQETHRVFTPRGSRLNPERFKAMYGGYNFVFDVGNEKLTKNAWEAFVESQAIRWPKAEAETFRPEATPGALIEEEGRLVVNTYIPAKIHMEDGDVLPFLNHLAKLLPDHRDQQIMLAYMAACVQHKGVKFQWWPLLQGVEGNGKSLLSRCVAYAIGKQHTHWPKAEEVSNKFNSWIVGKCFIAVEDVYYPREKREIIEALKPIITNEEVPVEYKGVDQVMGRNCANGILNSNHQDAVIKTRNDRRLTVFFTAQQDKKDIVRDGMDGNYFPDLYCWLRGDGPYQGQAPGYAKVAYFLNTYQIPDEFGLASLRSRAPETSSTADVLNASLGPIEQEINDAIEEGRPGFKGGWVSSIALDRLLQAAGRRVAINARRQILKNMGYDWHPSLPNGRVHNVIPMEGGKPKLFVTEDHPSKMLTTPREIVDAYTRAQTE